MTVLPIITLLTDFGQQDVYVGVIKGAIATINPRLQTIDLSHDLPPQNIMAASFCLLTAYLYFPPNTVHVAVVDPGVGSQRRAIAIEFERGFLVGPDNGLFSGILSQVKAISAIELTKSQYWRTNHPSNTFHGRDIFAPVGAHLASGVPLEALGRSISIDSLVKSSLLPYQIDGDRVVGYLQYIDRFGNLITNIPSELITEGKQTVSIAERNIKLGKTYSDVPVGELIAIAGSHGWLEIAAHGGSAAATLKLTWDDCLTTAIGFS
jgi:S-adenosyl-L-methionine hydrolase (adenosine-forming)